MKKYGLQLRVPASQQKKQPAGRPPVSTASIFREDDEDDVEREISRQANKNRALKDIEDQHKKALEQDPSVFAYDEVYDEMKQKVALPKMQEHEERKPRYIQHLMKKAEERQREHDVIYERKLAKERSQDEHLYADKDKFITSAYKKKLAEQAKWMEEQRLREIREEKEDVTKKKDLSDFYFSLGKNVAFGAREIESKLQELRKAEEEKKTDTSESHQTSVPESSRAKEEHHCQASDASRRSLEPQESKPASEKPPASDVSEQPLGDQPKPNHNHKRSGDAIAAAKERFLARKKAKDQ